MEFYRPTFAEISLSALAHNLDEVRRRLPSETGVLAMVKADAYGHGAVPVARKLASLGVAAFGVATVEEGSELRESGIGQPILVMGGLMGQGARAAEQIVKEGLTPIVHTKDVVLPLDAAAGGKRLPVHVKVDTGMGRMGARPESFRNVVEAVDAAANLDLVGVMTHFANVADPDFTSSQIATFEKATAPLLESGRDLVWHVANSAAVIRKLRFPAGAKIWVRPGIMLYGAAPFPEDVGKCDLQPAMSLKSQVILVKRVPAGATVSYGCTWKATRQSRIAVVPVGYADGYPWSLASKGEVCIRGKRRKVVGRVTMDFLMVDVTDDVAVAPGDEVVLLGKQGPASVTAEDLASLAGTIPYEIVCRVSKRMPRVYVE